MTPPGQITRRVWRPGIDRGDVVMHNDPYRGGCHMPELAFFGGEVMASLRP